MALDLSNPLTVVARDNRPPLLAKGPLKRGPLVSGGQPLLRAGTHGDYCLAKGVPSLGSVAEELRPGEPAALHLVEPHRTPAQIVPSLGLPDALDRDDHSLAVVGLEEGGRPGVDRLEVGKELLDHLLELVRAPIGAAPWQGLWQDDLSILLRRRNGAVEITLAEVVPAGLDGISVLTHLHHSYVVPPAPPNFTPP